MKLSTSKKVEKLDKGLRHKSGTKPEDFVNHYCRVLADHAYATRDQSWNELEKTLTHVLGMKIYYRRAFEILGLVDEEGDPLDPRDIVSPFEDAQAKALEDARENAFRLIGTASPEALEKIENDL